MKTITSIPFRGFDERNEVRIYFNGILPHWRQAGCAYFVTFRQADSLPEAVIRKVEHESRLWLKKHEIDPNAANWKDDFAKLPQGIRREYERGFGTTLDKHLDAGHGTSVLADKRIGNIVAEALGHFHGTRVLVGDLVVMPNHVHALMTPLPGFELEGILHSIKSYTANRINEIHVNLEHSGNVRAMIISSETMSNWKRSSNTLLPIQKRHASTVRSSSTYRLATTLTNDAVAVASSRRLLRFDFGG